MPLSWTDIKTNALQFSRDWEGESRETAEAKPFWEAFFLVFGIKRRLVATFEEPVRKRTGSTGFIDLFWPGTLIVEHKSKGADLGKATSQAFEYIQNLHKEGRGDDMPRYLVVSDFERFRLHDLEQATEVEFALRDFYKNVHHFAFIAGYERHEHHEEDPANFKAVQLMANLRDQLGDGGFSGHALERFLVRILFCLFADDTGIFERDNFRYIIENYTAEDGRDTGLYLAQLFDVLNTPKEKRSARLEPALADLPYVNGGLFEERLLFANFDRPMREALLKCTRFDWSKISPVIFGSLFQSVMEPRERRQIGAHYTSERDIMKLIRSLFLDELRAEFEKIRHNKRQLESFHKKLGELRFLDPACGCGNFLVVAYRELRLLELEVLKALYPVNQQLPTTIEHLLRVDVDCMAGIEIVEFPARIAEVAMWLVDHQMNLLVAETFVRYFVRLPLRKSARIEVGNALRIDWNTVLPASQCSYVLGNPPFVGGKYQDAEQKADMQRVAGHIDNFGLLDYVTCWHIKATEYIADTNISCAFVSTNSICQGEQVGTLWPYLLRQRVKIHFAHRTFSWMSEAKGKAHVHVIIVGFGLTDKKEKYIYMYEAGREEPVRVSVSRINPYLADGPDVIVTNRSRPILNVNEMDFGSMPNDGGHLLFTTEEMRDFVANEPKSKKYFRRCLGGVEFINGKERWCLWLVNANPAEIQSMPRVMERVEAVRNHRMASKRPTTIQLAKQPTLFGEIRHTDKPYLLVPRISSERRHYVPIGFMDGKTIATDLNFTISNATLYEFGILTSTMHMAWMRNVAGRLKSDYRYSAKLVYNNFPWPEVKPTEKEKIAALAQGVLDARAEYPDATLAALYDPLTMPRELLKAHQALDRAVDRLYRGKVFTSDMERFAHLIERYQLLAEGPIGIEKGKRRRSKK